MRPTVHYRVRSKMLIEIDLASEVTPIVTNVFSGNVSTELR